MRDLLDPLDRLTPGGLLVTGLALLVLGVMAFPFSPAASRAMIIGTLAAWLGAAAVLARGLSRGRRDDLRLIVIGIPAILALFFGAVAAGSAVQVAGITPDGGAGVAAEQVAGATASPTALGALSSPSASPEGSPGPSGSAGPSASPLPAAGPALRRGRADITSFSLSSPVRRGNSATATVATNPGNRCSIRVGYLSAAAAGAAGLSPQIAPASGVVTWIWTVDAAAPSGTYSVRVTCASLSAYAWWTRSLRLQ